jgi:hypothetical protein
MLFFREWLINEIGEGVMQTKHGSELFADPAMEIAMYMLYRQAYDSVSERDFGKAWSIDQWKTPSAGGTRAPAWEFTGIFPNESDLQLIRNEMGDDAQETADKLISAGRPTLSNCGGLSWRERPGMIKLTGMWGSNSFAKMRAGAEVVHHANTNGMEIFTGADAALKDIIEKAERVMPKFYKMGKVPSPTMGLETPPKEVIPLLYDIIAKNPSARGSGEWTGYNPNTGAMKFNLSGSGERDKFIYGNKLMWQKGISKALSSLGIGSGQIEMAKKALGAGGFMASMASHQINKALKNYYPNVPEIPPSGLLWLLDRAA